MKTLLIILIHIPFLCSAQVENLAPQSTDTMYNRYYQLLDDYHSGKRDYTVIPYLVNTSKELKDANEWIPISQDYINNYLLKLKEIDFYKKKNLEFIRLNIQNSKGQEFKIFYQNANKIDRIMEQKGYSSDVICYIIAKEEIDPVFTQATKNETSPDWNTLGSVIQEKYNLDLKERTILDAKLRWYGYKKKWNEYCKTLILKVEKYGPYGFFTPDFNLNNLAWDIFQHSNQRDELQKALTWSDSAVKLNPDPNWMDTKANLLYKIGNTKEAIALEEKAEILGGPTVNDIKSNLAKMKKGEPTWPTI